MQCPRGASRTIARSSPPVLSARLTCRVLSCELANGDTVADRQAQAWSRRELVGGLTTVGTTGVLVLRQVAADLAPEQGRRV
jgi:hypothetical protein